jgi:hypothetical protein
MYMTLYTQSRAIVACWAYMPRTPVSDGMRTAMQWPTLCYGARVLIVQHVQL